MKSSMLARASGGSTVSGLRSRAKRGKAFTPGLSSVVTAEGELLNPNQRSPWLFAAGYPTLAELAIRWTLGNSARIMATLSSGDALSTTQTASVRLPVLANTECKQSRSSALVL